MSMGYIAKARLVEQDDQGAIYEYWCLTQEHSNYEQFRENYDGSIMIILPDNGIFDRDDCLIKNASGTWSTDTNGKDHIACRLVGMIVKAYQQTGEFTENVYFHA